MFIVDELKEMASKSVAMGNLQDKLARLEAVKPKIDNALDKVDKILDVKSPNIKN
jgi:hypothetical protein